jgi:hypothetical protein
MTTIEPGTAEIEALDETLLRSGPEAMLDLLITNLEQRGEFRALLDALLLKARHEIGLPAILAGPLGELPEPGRGRYEERYIDALRTVGQKILDTGDLVSAWPYFRVLGEKEPVARALDAYEPDEGDPRLGAIIDIAFHQGVHPRRGFELILNQYGACSAISAFEGLPADEPLRALCADRLVRHLHANLVANLRAELRERGVPDPPEGASILALITGKPWLFADDAYHIDVSHLASVVRLSPMLTDTEALDLAIGLTDYGRHLSALHRYEGEPPFQQLYEDHAVYLRALRGQGIESAIQHFRAKLVPGPGTEPDLGPVDLAPAQVLVRLLVRLGRFETAIDVAAEHLATVPESMLSCPSLAQLCQRAGRPDRLAQSAREHGDLVQYATAILTARPSGS